MCKRTHHPLRGRYSKWVVRLLFEFGITIEDIRVRDCLALRWAHHYGHSSIVQLLTAWGLTPEDISRRVPVRRVRKARMILW